MREVCFFGERLFEPDGNPKPHLAGRRTGTLLLSGRADAGQALSADRDARRVTAGEDDVVLAVRGLSIRFQPGANLVEGVDLTVRRGETLCIVGESGCGKSITALALMGLLKMPPAEITGGTAHFEGVDMLTLGEEARSDLRGNRISMIFQEPMTSLNPAFTIGDQIAESIVRHRKVSAKEAAALALEMLRKVRIPAPETRYGGVLTSLFG